MASDERADGLRDAASRANRSIVETVASGITPAIAVLLVSGWLVAGLFVSFSEGWFSVLFAFTGATTFVMVFLLEHATRRDLRAALLKLDILVDAVEGADEEAIQAEQKSLQLQEELEEKLPR